MPNLAQAAKSELLVAVKGREGKAHHSFNICPKAQRLFMGPKYNAATSLKVEELGFGDFVHHHDLT